MTVLQGTDTNHYHSQIVSLQGGKKSLNLGCLTFCRYHAINEVGKPSKMAEKKHGQKKHQRNGKKMHLWCNNPSILGRSVGGRRGGLIGGLAQDERLSEGARKQS